MPIPLTANQMTALPAELAFILQQVCLPAGIELTTAPARAQEPQGSAYGAYSMGLNGKCVVFRIAKTTQDRPGAFVTLWNRCPHTKVIQPFTASDPIDYFLVGVTGISATQGATYRGFFLFDKQILMEKGILAHVHAAGKRAMRLFPPWSQELATASIAASERAGVQVKPTQRMSMAAKRTQAWQQSYFFPLHEATSGDLLRLQQALVAALQ